MARESTSEEKGRAAVAAKLAEYAEHHTPAQHCMMDGETRRVYVGGRPAFLLADTCVSLSFEEFATLAAQFLVTITNATPTERVVVGNGKQT